MRKWVAIIIGLYFISAAILILSAPEKKEFVRILVKKHPYSQIITSEDETFDIILYVSENGTFLTEINTIIDARLTSESSELQMNLKSIDDLKIKTNYQNDEYHAFRMRFNVSDYSSDDLQLSFQEAKLVLGYENDETVELDIGDVFLYWKTIEDNSDFDFFRLSGIYGLYNGKEILQGIAIGFDQFISGDIEISSIRTGIDDVRIDLNHSIEYNQNALETLYEQIGYDYQPFDTDGLVETRSISIQPGVVNAFPLKYHDQILNLSRFPLIIDYVVEGEIRTFIIDDFIFKSETYVLSEETQNVSVTDYRYRD